MTEPTKQTRRPLTTVGIWTETLALLDKLCESNRAVPLLATRSHRWSRQAEMHHLVVREAIRQKLIEPED